VIYKLIPHRTFPNICTLHTIILSGMNSPTYSNLLTLSGSTFKLHTAKRSESSVFEDQDLEFMASNGKVIHVTRRVN
jgi:hypothetical protein